MAIGMERSGPKAGMKEVVFSAVTLTVLMSGWLSAASGQDAFKLAPVPKACETPGALAVADSPLPNIAAALKERKKITMLAIGSTSASLRGPASGGNYAIVERFLESTFKGLDVEIVHRGVSGELAADAGERIKTEVALTGSDLVLWQLGTADALARVPTADFYVAVSETVAWLTDHKIDVILVGLRYASSMAGDLHYQAIRAAIGEIAKEQKILRISRYDAEETLEKIRREQSEPISGLDVSSTDQVCMAEYLARAIAAGIFARASPSPAPPSLKRP